MLDSTVVNKFHFYKFQKNVLEKICSKRTMYSNFSAVMNGI